jgi:hypothetical protein
LWISTLTPDSSTNKTDCHDIAEILLKVVLDHQPSSIEIYYRMMTKTNSMTKQQAVTMMQRLSIFLPFF